MMIMGRLIKYSEEQRKMKEKWRWRWRGPGGKERGAANSTPANPEHARVDQWLVETVILDVCPETARRGRRAREKMQKKI